MKSLNKFIYIYAVVALIIPNLALCFSESLKPWAALANILLPCAIYMVLMSLSRKAGKMVWWLFLLIFFNNLASVRNAQTGLKTSLFDSGYIPKFYYGASVRVKL